jgi:hypothetical protein
LLRRAIAAIHIILGIAVWRAKEAQFGARELLGNHHRSSQQAGWSWGWVSAIDSNGRTIWIVDAHRDDGKRFVVRADEKLTAFIKLEQAIRVVAANFS